MASHTKVLYTGVSSDLLARVYQHKHKMVRGFTAKYGVDRLAYYESTTEVHRARKREADQVPDAREENCLDPIDEPDMEGPELRLVRRSCRRIQCDRPT